MEKSFALSQHNPPNFVKVILDYVYTQFPLKRDTFWRLGVKFLGKIRDRLVLGNKFTVAIELFTNEIAL